MPFDLAKVDVEHMLETLELRNVRKATEDEYVFSCPYPLHSDGDNDPSAYMNTGEMEPWNATKWYCHTCHERGDARTLTAFMLDISPIKASRLLRQAYDPASYDPDEHSMVDWLREYRKQREQRATLESAPAALDPALLENYAVDWEAARDAFDNDEGAPMTDYMFRRGFSAEILDTWQVGYDDKTKRIVIPVHDDRMNLIGFKGRAWHPDHKPKYLVLGDSPHKLGRVFGFHRYEVSKVVFGLGHVIDDRIKHSGEKMWGDDTLIICEGELNVISLWWKGYFNAVAVNGSNFSETQRKLIVDNCEHAIVFLDWFKHDSETGELVDDVAGQEGTVRIAEALLPYVRVSVVPPHESDPADMKAETIHRLIEGAKSYRYLTIAKS